MEELRLKIEDDECSMIFDLDEFLPCKVARFKRFLRLIDKAEFHSRPRLFEQLSEHLTRREAEYAELWRIASKRCIDYQTEQTRRNGWRRPASARPELHLVRKSLKE